MTTKNNESLFAITSRKQCLLNTHTHTLAKLRESRDSNTIFYIFSHQFAQQREKYKHRDTERMENARREKQQQQQQNNNTHKKQNVPNQNKAKKKMPTQ